MIYFYLLMALLLVIGLIFITQPFVKEKKYSKAVLALILMSSTSLGLYYYWGAASQVATTYQAQQNMATVRQQLAQYKSVDDIIGKLKQTLKQNPDSAKGWYLLARLYYTQQQYPKAIAALTTANKLKPNDANILLQLALAHYSQEKQLNPTTKAHLKQVIQLEKNNPIALQILAADAYQQKHYPQAIAYWQQLLPQYSQQSETYRKIAEAIAKARAM